MSDLEQVKTKIESRGNWQTIIRPAKHVPDRVKNIIALEDILRGARVSIRGWDFPHFDDRLRATTVAQDYIAQSVSWDAYHEVWRFHQSGQFHDLAAFTEDWRSPDGWVPAERGWEPGKYLGIERTIYRMIETFILAGRLAGTAAGDEKMYIRATLRGLAKRQLEPSPDMMPSIIPHVASVAEYRLEGEFDRGDLTNAPNDYALEWSRELFRRFGWDAQMDVLKALAERFGRFR
jgi:hypothetical protein